VPPDTGFTAGRSGSYQESPILTEDFAMKAEIAALAEQAQQSLELLRRHL
jgi:hypothetical protein